MIKGEHLTVTGRTLAENCDRWTQEKGKMPTNQDVLRPLDKPLKSTGHIRILKGNLAPDGAVAKITGKEGLRFTGKARVFDTEDDLVTAVEQKTIKKGEKTVVVLRYKGPKGAAYLVSLSCYSSSMWLSYLVLMLRGVLICLAVTRVCSYHQK